MEANTVLSAASGQIDIYSYLDLKEYLHSLHNHIRAKLGRYSYQKFSEDLGLGSNNHSYQLIKGHRNMSPSTCLLIAEALKLELKERHYLSTLAAYARSRCFGSDGNGGLYFFSPSLASCHPLLSHNIL
jgi:uncharacterized protein (TIGR02147 family)